MIPRDNSRYSGTGGGGTGKRGSEIPFFCKRCGKTIKSRKSVMASVDICKKCRIRR